MTPEQQNTLFIVTIILFIITFLFTLFAIAGKINVEPKIKNGLYTAFILELGLAFFGYYKSDINIEYQTVPNKSEWVGISLDSMTLVQPILIRKKKNGDTIITDSKQEYDTILLMGKSVKDARNQLRSTNIQSKLTPSGLEIFTKNNEQLGIVPIDSLSLFNRINNNESTLVNKFKQTIKFESKNKGRWKKKYDFFEEPGFDIEVSDGKDENNVWMTGYVITQKKKKTIDTLFNSFAKLETREVLNVNNRIIHTYEHNSIFYMMFISKSNAEENSRFVYFQQLKIVSDLNTE